MGFKRIGTYEKQGTGNHLFFAGYCTYCGRKHYLPIKEAQKFVDTVSFSTHIKKFSIWRLLLAKFNLKLPIIQFAKSDKGFQMLFTIKYLFSIPRIQVETNDSNSIRRLNWLEYLPDAAKKNIELKGGYKTLTLVRSLRLEEISKFYDITIQDARLIQSALGVNRPIQLKRILNTGEEPIKELIITNTNKGKVKAS